MARPEKAYEFGPYHLDASQHLLFRRGQLIALPPKATQTLVVLVENHGRLVEKEDLMKAVWPDTFVEEANLTLQISALRKALQEESSHGWYIETIPRRGYRFVSPVVERATAGSQELRRSLAGAPHTGRNYRGIRLIVGIGLACVAALVLIVLATRNQTQKVTSATQGIRSLAVLPLQNLSGDPSQEYLADGLTEELVTDLAQLHGLRVISRTSSMRYKGTQKRLPEIARELNVEGVVEGSVARSEERVRIHVQLIRASDDVHIWASSYEGDPSDILGLQQAAAHAIAQEIGVRLSPDEAERLTTVRLINPAAHEAYLKGRYLFNQRTPESTKKSVAKFEEAVAKDPNYAAAYVALGEAYAALAANSIAAPKEVVPKAKQAANRALQLDPGMGEACATLAHLAFFYDWDLEGSEKEFRQAIELGPNNALAHQWHGLGLIAQKRSDEAEHEFRSALQIDPLSLMTSADLAQVYFYSGRFEETIAQARRILEINPNFPPAYDLIGMAYEQEGKYGEAAAEYQRYFDSGGGNDAKMHLAHLYAVAGKTAEARKLLHDMENPPRGGFASPYDIASVYAGLGDKSHAMYWMNEAVKARAAMIPFAGIDPLLSPLRTEPRFQALLRRFGLTQATELGAQSGSNVGNKPSED
jgi:TolB-like protein/DNA-binding winged helix-turn-helix (wHTH) protein/Tfp pilus assembly protein PilF